MIRDSKQLQIGKAGEYLVCADLIMKGFIAFPSEQGLPYDVILDTGYKILKVQVKTTEKYKSVPQRNQDSKAYIFNVKRRGANGKTRYEENEIDLFALVCLDTMKVGYVINKDMPDTINIRVDSLRGSYYDEKGVIDYENTINLFKTVKKKSEIAKILNINQSTVGRYLKPDWKPYLSNARYFSDFIRNKEWFYEI